MVSGTTNQAIQHAKANWGLKLTYSEVSGSIVASQLCVVDIKEVFCRDMSVEWHLQCRNSGQVILLKKKLTLSYLIELGM